jgi:hypothetical protein
LHIAGLLPIPAQAWKTKPTVAGQNAANPAVGSAPADAGRDESSKDATQAQAQRGCSIDQICPPENKGNNVGENVGENVDRAEGRNATDNEKITELEEDEEDIVIRRVGFVFLAYNVEYW